MALARTLARRKNVPAETSSSRVHLLLAEAAASARAHPPDWPRRAAACARAAPSAAAARGARFSSTSGAEAGGKAAKGDGGPPGQGGSADAGPGRGAAGPAAAGGAPMSAFERLSWIVCAGGIVLIAGIKVYTGEWDLGLKRRKTEAQLEEERVLEQHRRESIRYMLAGGSFEKGDAFDGLSPEEIEKFADGARREMGIAGGTDDPFEDMDPAEIDRYMRAHAVREEGDAGKEGGPS